VEDESHMLFECPAYDEARVEYAELFTAGPAMAQFLTQPTGRVAAFVRACQLRRAALVEGALAAVEDEAAA
jgi:alkylhydroperoxidase family enzyme